LPGVKGKDRCAEFRRYSKSTVPLAFSAGWTDDVECGCRSACALLQQLAVELTGRVPSPWAAVPCYDPLPARMISQRRRLRFVYFDGARLRPFSLADVVAFAAGQSGFRSLDTLQGGQSKACPPAPALVGTLRCAHPAAHP
jgi:hypothetical protein